MIVWGRKNDIQANVANVPDKWLARFAVERPQDVRKLGSSGNSTLLFRSTGVIDAVEKGQFFGDK